MTLTDLNGNTVTITDLAQALKQAAEYKDYSHVNKGFEKLDKARNAYWADICNKLSALQQKINK